MLKNFHNVCRAVCGNVAMQQCRNEAMQKYSNAAMYTDSIKPPGQKNIPLVVKVPIPQSNVSLGWETLLDKPLVYNTQDPVQREQTICARGKHSSRSNSTNGTQSTPLMSFLKWYHWSGTDGTPLDKTPLKPLLEYPRHPESPHSVVQQSKADGAPEGASLAQGPHEE